MPGELSVRQLTTNRWSLRPISLWKSNQSWQDPVCLYIYTGIYNYIYCHIDQRPTKHRKCTRRWTRCQTKTRRETISRISSSVYSIASFFACVNSWSLQNLIEEAVEWCSTSSMMPKSGTYLQWSYLVLVM